MVLAMEYIRQAWLDLIVLYGAEPKQGLLVLCCLLIPALICAGGVLVCLVSLTSDAPAPKLPVQYTDDGEGAGEADSQGHSHSQITGKAKVE